MAKFKRLPSVETATMDEAINELGRLANWASRLGFREIADRLEWVAAVLRHRLG